MDLNALFKKRLLSGLSTVNIRIVMQLIPIVLLAACLQVSAASYAQKVSISGRDMSLEKVFHDIRKQTGYNFIYANENLAHASRVSVNLKDASLEEVLRRCFADQPLTYKIDNKIIIVRMKDPLSATDALAAIHVSGTVADTTSGEPLVGVSIQVKGSPTGTVTDANGRFSLEVPEDAVLIVSYLGYTTKEVPVNGRSTLQITLASATRGLEQLVVIGYGEVQTQYLTGSVSSVKGADLQDIPASGVNQILGGRAAGVQVTNVSGAPGAPSVIRIRGGNSIQGNNNPLYVVDGVIMGQDYNLNNLNISDIKSINVLKDATAVAIYGTRGANGVVLITTKSGEGQQAGKATVSANVYAGRQIFDNRVDFLDGPELAAYANEDAEYRKAALPFADPSKVPNTNWIDLLTDDAPVYNANLSVSGVSANQMLNYYISGGFFDQEGIIKGSGFEKYNLTTNLDLKLSDYVSVGLRSHLSHTHNNNNKVSFNGGEGSLVHGIIPTRSVYDADGQFTAENPVSGTIQTNPMADVLLRTDYTNATNILTSVYLKVNPVDNLVFKTTFSPVISYTKHNIYNPSSLPQNQVINAGGNGKVDMGTTVSLLNENTVTYSADIGTHQKIDVLGGFTWQTESTEGVNGQGFAYYSDDETFNNLGSGSDPTRNVIGTNYNSFQLVSWLGRVNYTVRDKYLLTLVGRADGSSRFADGNKYGFFPAAAVAWRLGQEPFIQRLNVFDLLNLKVSYGLSGSQAIPSFRTLPVLAARNTTFNGTEQPGVILGRPANPDLSWETTAALDIGLTATLLKGRLDIDLDYYDKRTRDLLLNVQIPRQTGFDNKLQNLGSLRNQGIDLAITSTNISRDNFQWTTTLSLSGNRNKVLDLGGVPYINIITPTNQGGPGGRLIVGKTAPVFVGVEYLGTWKTQAEIDASGMAGQKLGGPHFRDTNGDGQISVDDFGVLGNPQPDFHGGIQNTFTYRNFSLDVFFQGSYGNDIFNTLTQTAFFGRGAENKYAIVKNRWTPDNPNSDIPRAGTAASFSDIFNNSQEIEDGSFLRLKSVRLSYSLPLEQWGRFWKNFQQVSLFFTGQNLLLISHIKLFDPETSKYEDSNQQYNNVLAGFADGAYPYAKGVNFGINVTL